MVKIPSPQFSGQPVGSVQTQPANTPFMNVRGVNAGQAEARDMVVIGGAMTQLATNIKEQNQRTLLREAEAEVRAFERQLKDPSTGMYRNLKGDAIGSTANVQEAYDTLRADLEGRYKRQNIGTSGQEALSSFMDGAGHRLWLNAASHELTQSMSYEEGLIEANIEMSLDNLARLDPAVATEEVQSGYTDLENRVRDLADMRGLSEKETVQMVEDYTSAAVLRTVQTLVRDAGPSRALEYLNEQVAAGRVDATVEQDILDKVQPAAEEEQAGVLARAAQEAGRGAIGTHTNPDAFNTRFAQGYGAPAGLIGSESGGRWTAQNNEVGSSGRRGHFGRIQIGRDRLDDFNNMTRRQWTGEQLVERGDDGKITEEAKRKQRIVEKWHWQDIDEYIVSQGYDKSGLSMDGMRAVAHIGGKGGLDEFVAGRGGSISDAYGTSRQEYYDRFSGARVSGEDIINNEPNQRIRDLARVELVKLEKASSEIYKRRQADLTNDLYAQIDESFTAGGDGKFSLENFLATTEGAYEQLGKNLDTVREYYRKMSTGEGIITDPDVRNDLMRMQTTDPQGFAEYDLQQDKNELSRADYQTLFDLQSDAIKEQKNEATAYGGLKVAQMDGIVESITGGKSSTMLNEKALFRSAVAAYVAQNGTAPDQLTMTAMAQQIAYDSLNSTAQKSVPDMIAHYDGPGRERAGLLGGDNAKQLARMNERGITAFVTDDTDLTLSIVNEFGDTEEVVVTPEMRQESYNMYTDIVGAVPRPSDLVLMMYIRLGGAAAGSAF